MCELLQTPERLTDTVKWLLLDADGVLQRARELNHYFTEPAAGDSQIVAKFRALERKFLTGGDFSVAAQEFWYANSLGEGYDLLMQDYVSADLSDEVHQTLGSLNSKYRLALATNQTSMRWSAMAPTYVQLMDKCFVSSKLGFAKPDHNFFRLIINTLDVSPAEIAFVDDRPENVASAAEIGLRACLFPRHADAKLLEELTQW